MKEQTPVKAHGLGGRSASFGEVFGDVFDHHSVVYEYANGVRMYALCRTQNGCYGDYSSTYFGTKGVCYLFPGSRYSIKGETNWTYRGPRADAHELEHKPFFAAIRSGVPINAGDYMARSTLVAVMGQLACYSGKELTWEQVAKSDFVFTPKVEDVRLDMEPPVKPDAKGWYPVPMPGLTEYKV
jgi:myo-inositol 2-dehydrogenase / D-chiro-inositol 1-dehydrogenase